MFFGTTPNQIINAALWQESNWKLNQKKHRCWSIKKLEVLTYPCFLLKHTLATLILAFELDFQPSSTGRMYLFVASERHTMDKRTAVKRWQYKNTNTGIQRKSLWINLQMKAGLFLKSPAEIRMNAFTYYTKHFTINSKVPTFQSKKSYFQHINLCCIFIIWFLCYKQNKWNEKIL